MTSRTSSGRHATGGFTLLELMLSIGILALVTTVTYLAFSTVATAWKRGMALTENLHHGDFVAEQLVMALRSAYFPSGGNRSAYGFIHEDNGDGEGADDVISWVKLGSSLVGKDCPFAGSPHRVIFSLENNEDGERCVAVRAWRVEGQSQDFDKAEIEPMYLSNKVIGFDFIWASGIEDDEIQWESTWDKTNQIPVNVSITLFLEPIDEDGEPIEIKRAFAIPVAPLSWKK